ncbi:MAG: MFS transporter [Bifidobacteriaceae bacterium]|jgi:MFS family permease|nr:MFS transporter [Bifidobacteriaceae bacterium]
MLKVYKKIFQTKNTKQFAFIGIISRFPQPIYQMAILFVSYHYTSSWIIPAALSSTVALSYALAIPFLASLVDKYGQSYVILRLTIVYLISITGIIGAFVFYLPYPFLFLFAATSGISQYYYGSLTRTRWNWLIKNPKLLHTAYAFEGAADDFVFILGPVIGVILATGPQPIISLIIIFFIAGIGNLLFWSLKSTEPPIIKIKAEIIEKNKTLAKPVITIHGASFCIAVACILGINFGLVDVVISAIYTNSGQASLSGFILAIGSISSLISGLLYGLIHINMPQTKRMLILTIAATLILANYIYLYNNIYLIPLIIFLSSFVIAPIFTCLNILMKDIVPDARLTQGFSWISSAVNLGIATGSLIAGITIDHISIKVSLIILVIIMILWNTISYPWAKTLKINQYL